MSNLSKEVKLKDKKLGLQTREVKGNEKIKGCMFALIGLWGGGGGVSIAPLWCR